MRQDRRRRGRRPGDAARRDRRLPGLPAAGRMARAGGPSTSAPRSATRTTGAGRCRASATRRRRCSCSAWRRRRTGRTAPGGCSPVTVRVISCSPRCIAPASPTSRRRCPATTGCASTVRGCRRRCAAPRRPTPLPRPSVTRAVRTSCVSSPCCPTCASWCASVRSATTRRARCSGCVRRPRFGHGVEVVAAGGLRVICAFHPSQQNTFTGRLTAPMLDDVFTRARHAARATHK